MTQSSGVGVRSLAAHAPISAAVKRITDLVLSAVSLLLLAPLFPVVALLIKLDSKGPVLFRQERVGRGFRPFKVFKFRTMVTNGQRSDRLLTVEADPRVTRVGRLLRSTKIDEFPQLINVLKGDMSLVGPRPEVPKYVDLFRSDFERILRVRPGVTDPASFKYRNEESILARVEDPEREYVERILPDKLRLAEDYIRRSGFSYDLTILLRTFIEAVWGQIVPMKKPFLRHRRPLVVAIHVVLTIAANYGAFWLRFDGDIPSEELLRLSQFLPWLVLCRAAAFVPFQLYEGLWRYTSLWDLRNIAAGVGSSSILFYALVRFGFGDSGYPRSVFVTDAILAVALMGGVRLVRRVYRELIAAKPARRILVIGAGDIGEMVVRELKKGDEAGVVGFIDDDPAKVGQRIHGVPVLGTREDLLRIMPEQKPHEILVAIAEPDPARLRGIVRTLESYKVPIKTVPNLRDLGVVAASPAIRDLTLEDLLPRVPLELDADRLWRFIGGRRVLVTGAGGAVGSELARQITANSPALLILLDRSERALHQALTSLTPTGTGALFPVVGDVTSEERVRAVLQSHRPEIVFHAAAHTHVSLMERDPCEAVQNNVRGTRVVSDACLEHGVGRLVLISANMAVNPASVLGAAGRAAELVAERRARLGSTAVVTVRFGAVLEGRDSIVPRILEQIRHGGPVTVPHRNMQRCVMQMSDVVRLVLHAASIAQDGGVFVLDMGDPVAIGDLARDAIRLAGYVPGKDITIAVGGLAPGEKLSEELTCADETVQHSDVRRVLRVLRTGALTPLVDGQLRELEHLAASGDATGVVRQLCAIVPTYRPSEVWTRP